MPTVTLTLDDRVARLLFAQACMAPTEYNKGIRQALSGALGYVIDHRFVGEAESPATCQICRRTTGQPVHAYSHFPCPDIYEGAPNGR